MRQPRTWVTACSCIGRVACVDANPHPERARTFGAVAEEYDRWRTSYPASAVDWLTPRPPARVADVGAGTGKLTGLLVARGLTVDAVEPDPRMLAVLARNIPDARPHQSDSTAIPVEDQSLDAVLVADAWHWFDPEKTITELRRVLKPSASLGLVWNVTAEPVEPWEVAMAGSVSDRYDRETKSSTDGLRERFWYFPEEEYAVNRFLWTREVTPEEHAASWATTSMAIAMDSPEREVEIEAKRSEFQRLCDEVGRSSMPVRSIATCIRWTPEPQI